MYSIQHYVIKFVSDLRQVGGFLLSTPGSSTNKTDHHDITEILLKLALNTINQTKPFHWEGLVGIKTWAPKFHICMNAAIRNIKKNR
jgi:hypothetical protein